MSRDTQRLSFLWNRGRANTMREKITHIPGDPVYCRQIKILDEGTDEQRTEVTVSRATIMQVYATSDGKTTAGCLAYFVHHSDGATGQYKSDNITTESHIARQWIKDVRKGENE